MKIILIAATIAAAVVSGTAARAGTEPRVITVSCFRGPWKEVIWDRANPVFIDSLIHAGYDFPTAHAIGDRICRDQAGVDDPDYLKAEMVKVLHEAPRFTRK